MKIKNNFCPCGSGCDYALCCSQFLHGKSAGTAEQLMRSRYTAYTLEDETYLLETWHSTTRPQTLNLSSQNPIKWVDLRILKHSVDPDNSSRASVEFVVRYKSNGRAQKMHELSAFVNENGRWFYLDGQQID
jgi:SEC-C motif-containing protein